MKFYELNQNNYRIEDELIYYAEYDYENQNKEQNEELDNLNSKRKINCLDIESLLLMIETRK